MYANEYPEEGVKAQQLRSGQIDGFATKLSLSMKELDEHLTTLTDRLTPVLRPDDDKALTAMRDPVDVRSPLAHQLADTLEHSARLSRRVAELTARVDL